MIYQLKQKQVSKNQCFALGQFLNIILNGLISAITSIKIFVTLLGACLTNSNMTRIVHTGIGILEIHERL